MYRIRAATAADVPQLQVLISASVRGLSGAFYTPAQIDSSLRHLFGVDTQLIADGTYYIVEADGALAAAGGWSGRRTLYGGDQYKESEDPRLDPATEAARIRAFFVHPAWARRGLARLLFARCEEEARSAGFRAFELLATLPGEPLYLALGFAAEERVTVRLPDGVELRGTRMRREIDPLPEPSGAGTPSDQ
jgi:GNAT superfamily N-acetyltransferase